ncbi:vitamin B12 transporter [Aquamicrobium lusatiense]|uniref:Vitamin B12 transporter n=1 Tax=Aquamicrobium lusatiense TaxID=89772 RepID=A0A7W9RZ58_9HYPH|nr:TonB-dependent receptor [Aquamicrobium lusatiense]MBB6010895.1 vitamin B12 transporter [Aquamicrobium lusatiense]
MRTTILAAGICSLTLTGAVRAQDEGQQAGDVIELKTISVTANRTPTRKNKVGSKVEQITQAEIGGKSRPVLSDYLNLLPGVSVARNGGLGGTTGLFVRGLGSGYVKTLYNGIDISDPTGTQVLTHYQYLLTGGISNVDVLKGSQSTLYGSSAIAGLVNISTLGQPDSGVHHTVEAEGGSFGTVRGRYGFTAANEGSGFAGNVSGLHTDGISALADGRERDGLDSLNIDLTAEHRINEAFSVFGSVLHLNSKAEFDGNGPDDPDSYERARMTGGRFGLNFDLMDGRLKNTVSAQGFKSDRESVWGGFPSSFIGTRQKIDYQGSFEATERVLLQYGLDHEKQEADDAGGGSPLGKFDLTGVWAQAVLEPVNDLVLTAGLRHDEHSEFGGHTTYRGTASYLFATTGTRLHSSYGTGFLAPSLYQLYAPSSVGNPNLQPETSRSFDIGVEQHLLGGALTADVTYFHIRVDDKIDWINDFSYPWGGYYDQTPGTTRSKGVEASFTYAATGWLDLGGSYTYTDSRKADGTRNVRIPRHAVVLSAEARPAEKWTIGADVKFVADVVDGGAKLDDYVLLNAKVAYQLTESTQIYLRGENLLNENYQTVKGYGTPGIAAFAGIKAKF